MQDKVIEFTNLLRKSGIRVSVAEAIDAFQALDELSLDDREIFRDALRASIGSPRACSGDMYCGVPAITPLRVSVASSAARAKPKSVIATRSIPSSSKMFAGLMSRCTRPCA